MPTEGLASVGEEFDGWISFGGPRCRGGPDCGTRDDDLLRLAIWWVKNHNGNGSDFVEQAALVFELLRQESGSWTDARLALD